jgi:hypothetical protein
MQLTAEEESLILALRKQKEEEVGRLTISQVDRGWNHYIREIKFSFVNGEIKMSTQAKSKDCISAHGFFVYDFNKTQAQEVIDYLKRFVERG